MSDEDAVARGMAFMISEHRAPPARPPRGCPGGTPTLASDVFRLGAFTFLVLMGTPPIPSPDLSVDGVATFYTKLRTEQAPPVRTLRADLPEGFAAVIDRCLQRDPLDRYQNAAAMLDDLVRHRE